MRDLRRNRKRGKEQQADKRQKGKLKVGVDIPSPDEIKTIIDNAKGAGVRCLSPRSSPACAPQNCAG